MVTTRLRTKLVSKSSMVLYGDRDFPISLSALGSATLLQLQSGGLGSNER
jgi:hypothetical protein